MNPPYLPHQISNNVSAARESRAGSKQNGNGGQPGLIEMAANNFVHLKGVQTVKTKMGAYNLKAYTFRRMPCPALPSQAVTG